MMKLKWIWFYCCLVVCGACTEDGSPTDKAFLPKSYGGNGEILLFMDSVKWAGKLGDTIRAIFGAPQAGSLQGERIFTVRQIDPLKINKTLKTHKNLLFVSSFDSQSKSTRKLKEFFPQEGLKKIRENKSIFMFPIKDVYAQNQQVLHIFGNNDEELLANIRNQWDQLRRIFSEAENQRLKEKLGEQTNPKLQELLAQKHYFKILTPTGYQLVEEIAENEKGQNGFVWLRFPEAQFDKNIVVAYQDYRSENQFRPDSLIAWRNAIAKKYLFGDPKKPDSYIVTETLEPPVVQRTQLNDKFAMEIYGLWKTNNISMGGGFVSLVFVDQSRNRLYYLEGFIYAPNQPKREYLRELRAIISSWETASQSS